MGLKIYPRIFMECLLYNILPCEHLAKFFLCSYIIFMCYIDGKRLNWEIYFLFSPLCPPQSSLSETLRVWPLIWEKGKKKRKKKNQKKKKRLWQECKKKNGEEQSNFLKMMV